MRGKRAKAYRKLMRKYELYFKFRQPYQVLIDAEFLQEVDRCKMDLNAYLTRTLQGEVKPMITQCSIRHLYLSSSKSNPALVDLAKTLERRRCNHHMLDDPLSTYDCLTSVIHPSKQTSGSEPTSSPSSPGPQSTIPPSELRNKHRYVIASQDVKLRTHLRRVPGVPVVYLNRSVMILEPISDVSTAECNRQEQAKFTEGILEKTPLGKRKRDDGELTGDDGSDNLDKGSAGVGSNTISAVESERKKKTRRGPKQPNPLSVKKKKPKLAAAPTSDGARTQRQK